MTEHGWFKVYRELWDKPIWLNSTPGQKVVLMTILKMANHKANKWEWREKPYEVMPGQFITSTKSIEVAGGKGITRQVVRGALKRFEKLGFITMQTTNESTLITVSNWGKYQVEEKTQPSMQPIDNQPTTTNKNVKNDKKNKPSSSQLEEDFEKLWGLYPRKEGKKPAFAAYKRAVTRSKNPATNKQIQDGIVAYKQQLSQSGTDKKFIKQGSTFFSQEAWNDYDELAKPEHHEQPVFNADEWLMMAYRTRGTVEGVIEAIEQEGPPISPEYAKTFIETLGR
ncbi:hypothetical protein [Lacticaseibacillus saniviri]